MLYQFPSLPVKFLGLILDQRKSLAQNKISLSNHHLGMLNTILSNNKQSFINIKLLMYKTQLKSI